VATMAGLSRDEAMRLLRSADGEVKTAIVMQRRGIDAGIAREVLRAAAGDLRAAMRKTGRQGDKETRRQHRR